MKLRSKLNLFSLITIIALTLSVAVAGSFTIRGVVLSLNERILQLEMDNIHESVEEAYTVLMRSGVLEVESYVKNIQEMLLDDFRQYHFGKTGSLFVLKKPGKVVFHPRFHDDATYKTAFTDTMFRMKNGLIRFESKVGERLCSFRTFEPWGWLICLSVSTEEIFEQMWRYINQVSVIAAVIVVINIFIFSAFVGRIVDRIDQTLECAEKVQNGDLSARIDLSGPKDELGRLRQGINSMIDTIEARTAERQEAEMMVRKLNEELENRVGQRTAELERALTELETFSYSLSHDLRTPLRALDGYSQCLLEDYHSDLDDAGRTFLERIRQTSQHMARLLDDILRLNRVSRVSIQPRPVDLSQVADEVFRHLKAREPRRQVKFSKNGRLWVDVDPEMARIMILNLMENAWKFTSAKETALIELGARMEKEIRVFYVKDNGVGFDMNYSGKLFKPFNRLHEPSEFSGTGIGLAIVEKIVKRHGGKIWAESELDKGTTVFFSLGADSEKKVV